MSPAAISQRRCSGSRRRVSPPNAPQPCSTRRLIVPVLTAHPTEVMRKSMIDHRNRIAELMRHRDLGRTESPEGDAIEAAILRQIALLWQTRPLRRERLYVADEVEIALTYLRDVFLPVLPALYARWERVLGHRPRSFLRLGSWIGGDRDGNPNVTAESLHIALGRASQAVLESYLRSTACAGRRAVALHRACDDDGRSGVLWPSAAAIQIPRGPTNPIAER